MNIFIISTLDTKGEEAGFIREEILKHGHTPIVVDPGSTGEPQIHADITREEIAKLNGITLRNILETGDKALIQAHMTDGLVNIISQKYAQNEVGGVIAVGGGQGTAIATAAMRALPVGIPKVMISTVACGKTEFGPYVGTKDIMMIHSVADIAGLNFVTKKIISQASAAVCAMAEVVIDENNKKNLVAITQAGVTTPGVSEIKRQLEREGKEVIVFHCNGIGGKAMEDLILDGKIQAVIDYSPHEITDLLYDGLMPALPGRMTAAGQMGIPQMIAPGCADVRLHVWQDENSQKLIQAYRPYVRHTPTHTHFRTTYEEMWAVAQYIAEHLNQGKGPRGVIIPLQGYSMMNREGSPLYDEYANQGFLDGIQDLLQKDLPIWKIDAHINDKKCADEVVRTFNQIFKGK